MSSSSEPIAVLWDSLKNEVSKITCDTGLRSGKGEDLKGSIKSGKLADMVVLDRDILTVSPKEIGHQGADDYGR